MDPGLKGVKKNLKRNEEHLFSDFLTIFTLFSDFNVPTDGLDGPNHGRPCPDSVPSNGGLEIISSLFCVQIGLGAHTGCYKKSTWF